MLRRWSSLLTLFLATALPVAAQTKDPLRFVPNQAEVVVQVDRPRHLIEAVEKNEQFQEAQKLAGIREYYDTTNFQMLYQLIGYFEKQLGKSRDEIIDDISAGGV